MSYHKKAKIDRVTLRVVHIGDKYPKGAFEAIIRRQGHGNRSKQATLTINSEVDAYEIVDLWAEDMAKELGIPYHHITYEDLSKMLAAGSRKLNGYTNALKIVGKEKVSLGHLGYFRKDVKKAFALEGFAKVKEVIEDGLKVLNELETNRARVEKNSSKAKVDVARAMYNTFVDTGVDTSIYCNDDYIVAQYNRFKEESKQGVLV